MGKINGCLKWLFIFCNMLFLIVGCLLICVAVYVTAISIKMSTFGGVSWIWVITLGVFGISALGIFAACSEKKLFLKIFAGFMGIGMIIMLIFGTVVAVLRNSVYYNYDTKSKEVLYALMEDDKQEFEMMQDSLQCCGVVSAQDWKTEIPASCECINTSATCISKPAGSSGPDHIYFESCSNNFFYLLDIGFKISLGFLFGFAVTALLGLLSSILMIYQIRHHDGLGGPAIAMRI